MIVVPGHARHIIPVRAPIEIFLRLPARAAHSRAWGEEVFRVAIKGAVVAATVDMRHHRHTVLCNAVSLITVQRIGPMQACVYG